MLALAAIVAANLAATTGHAVTPTSFHHHKGHGRARSDVKIIGYYDAKAQKALPMESIPYQNLTHIVLVNALKVDRNGTIHLRPKRSADELSAKELVHRLAALPTKLVLSLRGHQDDVAFDELAEQQEVREKFAVDMAVLVRDWGASGVEIEWHADDAAGDKPLSATFDASEQYHLLLLLRDLHGTLHAVGDRTLSLAVRPWRQEIVNGSYVHEYTDWLSVRAYSMRSLGDPHHSSIKDMKASLKEWTSKGVPHQKLVLGTPAFARPGGALRITSRENVTRQSWQSIVAGAMRPAPNSDFRGDVFLELATGKSWWMSGMNTTKAKTMYIHRKGYGGIALRDLNHDVLNSQHSILQSILSAENEFYESHRRHKGRVHAPSFIQRLVVQRRIDGTDMENRDEF